MRVVLATLLMALLAASAQAKVGDLYVADSDDGCSGADLGAVYRVDPSTRAIALVSAAGDLRSPRGIVSSPDGNTLYVADANAFDPVPPNPSGGLCPYDSAWDGPG